MPKINNEILSNLYGGANPYETAQLKYVDGNYPHTNIREKLIDYLLKTYKPTFWLELGSFVGGSALKVAKSLKENNLQTGIICCDPFCGDVNMWDWEINPSIKGKDGVPYKFIGLEEGLPTIYKRFISNIFFEEHSDVITPLQVTSIVAIKLLERLYSQKRISELPTIIYLDSAHEADETYLELANAWRVLPSGGILLGDDWSWDAVKNDVLKFSKTISIENEKIAKANESIPGSQNEENIFLYDGQWVLFKR
jgi:predicted O-methyltransferase YrrM